MRKQIEKLLSVLILVSGIPMLAFAEPSADEAPFNDSVVPVMFGEPEFEGKGCPDANHRTVLISPDANEISIMYNDFSAVTSSTKKFNLVNCKITMPIDVPDGLMVSQLRVVQRGVGNIPEGGMGTFSREYSVNGKKVRKFVDRITPEDDLTLPDDVVEGGYDPAKSPMKNFLFEDKIKSGFRSKCGEGVILSVDTTLMAKKDTLDGSNVEMQLFAQDGEIGISYYLEWTNCKEDDDE